MPAAHAGIEESNILGRTDVFRNPIGLSGQCRDEIFHFIHQSALRMQRHPYFAERVFHHIADNPVRREELSGGRLLIAFKPAFLSLLYFGICFFICDIELIEPSHNLYILAILVGHAGDNVADKTFFAQEVVWQKQFGVVADMLKQEWHIAGIAVADGNQQTAVKRGLGKTEYICRKVEILVNIAAHRFLKNLGTRLSGNGRDYHRRVVAVGIHKAESHHSVEPSVSNLFDDTLFTLVGNLLAQFAQLLLLAAQFGIILGEDKPKFRGNQRDEFLPRLLRECF